MSKLQDLDALPKVMGDDGQFHATDEAVDLSGTPIEAWVALLFFWAFWEGGSQFGLVVGGRGVY